MPSLTHTCFRFIGVMIYLLKIYLLIVCIILFTKLWSGYYWFQSPSFYRWGKPRPRVSWNVLEAIHTGHCWSWALHPGSADAELALSVLRGPCCAIGCVFLVVLLGFKLVLLPLALQDCPLLNAFIADCCGLSTGSSQEQTRDLLLLYIIAQNCEQCG